MLVKWKNRKSLAFYCNERENHRFFFHCKAGRYYSILIRRYVYDDPIVTGNSEHIHRVLWGNVRRKYITYNIRRWLSYSELISKNASGLYGLCKTLSRFQYRNRNERWITFSRYTNNRPEYGFRTFSYHKASFVERYLNYFPKLQCSTKIDYQL